MKVSDEQAQTLREEYGSGDFYEARVIYDLLTDREEVLRLIKDLPDHADLDAAQFKINMVVSEANAKLRAAEQRIEKLERVVRACADTQGLASKTARDALRTPDESA